MFCQNCGNELADGAAFCPSCGTAQNNAAVSLSKGVAAAVGAANVADERKQVLAVMDNSFSVMTSIKQKENEIEEMEAMIEEAQLKGRKRYIVFAVFIGSLAPVIFEPIFKALGGDAIGGILALATWVGVVALFVMRRNKFKKQEAECTQNKQSYETTLQSLKNDETLSWLPYDYRDSTSFTYLYTYLTNMRANSLKEAINLYETEKHQARLELISAVTAQAASDAAASANAAAGAAAASAFFSLFK
jgi:hypothetical protein